MSTIRESREDTGLAQNALFIQSTYRKAVISGMLSILSVNINVVVDGILVGRRLGQDALAAITLSLPVYWALCVVGSFLAAGTEIPAARAIGMGNSQQRDAYFCTGLNTSLLVSLLITLLGLLFREPIVSFLGAEGATRDYVMQYVVITLIGALPKIGLYIPFWYLRLDGKNADVTWMMTGMTVINIVLDVLFVYFLDMGVFGAGLASVLATAAAFLFGMFRLFAKGSPYRWRLQWIRRADWHHVASAGFPSAFNNLCATVRLLIINGILLRHGGSGLVAVFTAVNGLSGFGDCVTLGVPAAGGVMLSVFSGEKDHGSCRLLLREEWKTGCVSGAVFLVLSLALSGVITKMYGLPGNILIPLLWLSLSLFPALFLNLLSTYYNMTYRNIWANALIFLRTILTAWIALRLTILTGASLFSFLLTAELGAVLVWWAATGLHHRRHPSDSRYLMNDLEDEKKGRVLNFSVEADLENIVTASERISRFCEANGMSPRSTMQLEMSMEEVMTLIRQVNEDRGIRELRFDLRAYCFGAARGIRIRYSGIPFNPFVSLPESDGLREDMYMGVHIIMKIVENINYQSTFGVNTLQIALKGD
ncbi:MAG: hypothetical protein II888_05685 [Clostridia bacterium]|nr:hypothetical protein [Clostridia bacterium]